MLEQNKLPRYFRLLIIISVCLGVIMGINKLYRYVAVSLFALSSVAIADNSVVDIDTNYGTITVELYNDDAPVTVTNFLSYVSEGFYEETLFHRVIDNFMIQGGGFARGLTIKETHDPIFLESNQGLSNVRGMLAMARTSVPDSATSQFFINTVDNTFLDYQNDNSPGYAVFGEVIEGMAVVDEISGTPTETVLVSGVSMGDVPKTEVIIKAIRAREGQLSFQPLNASYQTGDVLEISLQEEKITRQRPLDLWVAARMPDGRLLYFTEQGSSFKAGAFKTAVAVDETVHQVFTLTIPAGLSGNYTLLAIFNEPDAAIGDYIHAMRSNIAIASVELK